MATTGSIEVNQRPEVEDLIGQLRKWYYLPDDVPFRVVLATVITSKLPGDSLWVYIIGAPSDMKTEILRALGEDNEFVYMATDMTPKALLSGLSKNENGKEGIDLLPKLNGRTFVIRDFTTILSKRWEETSELLGRLRTYYDGEYSDNWGSMGNKRGKSHFNMLAAVTSSIDDFASAQQKLGERFLKVRVDTDEEKAADFAAKFIGQEDEIRAAVSEAIIGFLKSLPPSAGTRIPDDAMEEIKKMARSLAYLRTGVPRDRDHDVVCQPEPEKPPRLVKQLIKLGTGLAVIQGHDSVGDSELQILARVVWDTMPQIRKALLLLLCGVAETSLAELNRLSGLPKTIVYRTLEDLRLLGFVDEKDDAYALAKKGSELLSGMWDYE